jgi:hypothetical protein
MWMKPFLVERLASIIEECGRIPKSKTAAQVESSDEFRKDSLGSLDLTASKRLIYYGS